MLSGLQFILMMVLLQLEISHAAKRPPRLSRPLLG